MRPKRITNIGYDELFLIDGKWKKTRQGEPVKMSPFDGAFIKGYQAFQEGNAGTPYNPYEDIRTDRGQVTFARAFIRAWDEGYAAAEKEAKGK